MSGKLSFRKLDFACSLAFLSYAGSAVFLPVCLVVLIEEFQTGFAMGGTLEVVRTSALVLSLVASGFIAARLGKVSSLAAGLVSIGVGMLLFSVAPSLTPLMFSAFLMGLGAGIVEALVNPVVQDQHPEGSGRYLNFVNAFWSVGVLLSTLITGDLLHRELSWRPIAMGFAALSILSGLALWCMREEDKTARVKSAAVLQAKRTIVKHPAFGSFVVMMFLAGFVEGGLTFWSASFVQLQFETGPRAGGFAIAAFSGGMILGRLSWGTLVPQHHLIRSLFWSAFMGIVPCILIPFAPGALLCYGLLFLAGCAMAPFWPTLQSVAAESMDVDATSLFILLSCAGIPGFAAAAWLVGILTDSYGIVAGIWLIPLGMALLATLLRVQKAS